LRKREKEKKRKREREKEIEIEEEGKGKGKGKGKEEEWIRFGSSSNSKTGKLDQRRKNTEEGEENREGR
jgi:hypothetical protein